MGSWGAIVLGSGYHRCDAGVSGKREAWGDTDVWAETHMCGREVWEGPKHPQTLRTPH